MRAPPELETSSSGMPRVDRAVAGADELLADRAAHRAAHEGEVHHRELERMRVEAAEPTMIASVRPVFSSASASRSR